MWGRHQGGQGQYQESQRFGGNGGNPQEFIRPNLSLVAVRGRCGSLIDSLQFLFVDVTNGQYVESPKFGGNGGANEIFYQAPPGQYIDKVYTVHGDLLNQIRFETNQGDRSRNFGSEWAAHQGQFVAQGKRITGVRVGAGSLIDRVQFLATQ